MAKTIAEAIMDRGFPLITDYISFDELQKVLINTPTPNWAFPPYQYHFPTSPSGYYGCPSKIEKGKPSFVMVRGTQFHEHYGPLIPKAFGLKEGQYSIEPMAVMPITCNLCKDKHEGKDSCGVCQFPFGGSLDFPIWINEWLIDFKFSMQSPEKMGAYVYQVAAYAAMINAGYIRKEPHGAKATWEWNKSNYRIKYVSILHIHPDSFKCTEIRVPIVPFEKILPLVMDHHLAKAHGKIVYRTNKYCKNCENLLKPRLVLTQPKRGATYEMNLEPNEDGIMVPQVELSCTQMGRIYDPAMDESFEIQIYDSKGRKSEEEIQKESEKTKSSKSSKSPKPPKLYESKRRVRCKKCDELVNKYYKLNKKNHCEKCALELGLLPPIEIKKPLNVDFGDDGNSDLIGEDSMNINCSDCGKSFTPTHGVLRCDDCLHPKVKLKTNDNSMLAENCYYYKNGGCEGASDPSGTLEACNHPMDPMKCLHYVDKGSPKAMNLNGHQAITKKYQNKIAAMSCRWFNDNAFCNKKPHNLCNYLTNPEDCPDNNDLVPNTGEDYVAYQKREKEQREQELANKMSKPSIYDRI